MHCPYHPYGCPYYHRFRRPYGFWNFMLDIIMCALTGGLWIIWIFVREMRNH